MHKKKFIEWYPREGFKEFLGIWKRFIIFIPRYFSVVLLLKTLVSPWHKNISFKSWRGFNPARSAEIVLWNLFSRGIGAIVRICVIFFAMFVWLGVIIFGTGIMLIYVLMPIVWLVFLILIFVGYWEVALVIFIISALVIILAYKLYRLNGHGNYQEMSMLELDKQSWFHRVYERIGVVKEDIPKEILADVDKLNKFLIARDITADEFNKIITWEIEKQVKRERSAELFSAKRFFEKRPIGLNWHFGYTINLDRYAQDVTRFDTGEIVYDPFYGLEDEMNSTEIILSRPSENSVMLIGEPGVGKNMIVEELSRRIRSGYFAHSKMEHMRVLKCDFSSIMSQARNNGEDSELLINKLFHEAAYAGNVILVVDNFKDYINTDNKHGFSFSSIVDHYGSLESFRIIALATKEGFYEKINKDQLLLRHFDVIKVEEMNDEQSMKVLFSEFYGKKHTPLTFQALRQIIINSNRYTNTSPLPARAIDLAMEILIKWQARRGRDDEKFITAQTVDEFIRGKTGIPIGRISVAESEQLLSLEDTFHKHIIGQNYAVKAVASAVRRMRSGMSRPNKPAGSFLFLGPTGVGKTEMAKVLADQYFGSRKKVIRLDMSEFQGDTALDRLIGSKELNQQGILTTAVREHPYTLLLLDEVEKANPKVLDLFLQVLDEGFLHDSFGKKINFTTMIVIATSNAAAVKIKELMEQGVDYSQAKSELMDVIISDRAFRPEFLNRFDDIIIFNPLKDTQIVDICKLLLAKFSVRMKKDRQVTVIFDDDVADKIIENGFDATFGARSLIHYIDDTVADVFAKKIITNNIKNGEVIHFKVVDLDA